MTKIPASLARSGHANLPAGAAGSELLAETDYDGALPEPALSELSFPGCRSLPMTAEQHEIGGRVLEFWDAATETAWVLMDGPSPDHEAPSQALAQLVERIAAVRGAPIRCFGTAGLTRARSEPLGRVAHPDQIVYLDARRAAGGPHGLFVGGYDAPDVVVEVDNTTDVRRNKLKLYEAWGIKEVWVEVPDTPAKSRPRKRRSGLTIYLHHKGAYRIAAASGAFPGWRVDDIHQAMNEAGRSAYTNAILERVGRRMGEREGTTPDDDSLMRSLRADARAAMIRRLLEARGIAVSPNFPRNIYRFAQATEEALASAALACTDEADFAKRLTI